MRMSDQDERVLENASRGRRLRTSMYGLPVLLALVIATAVFSLHDGGPPPFRVVLDAGHGADELGATGFGLVERDSNLDMAKRVGELLRRDGIEVIYTRTDDGRAFHDGRALTDYSAIFADLDTRIAIANEARADLFISIHSNSFSDLNARGVEVIYNPDRPFAERNRALAEAIRASVVASLAEHGYEVAPGRTREDTSMEDWAGRRTPYLVLGGEREMTRQEMDQRGGDWEALGYGTQASVQTRATQMPGVIVELFYISNEADAALLKDDSVRHYLALGVAAGIKNALRARAASQ
ncbi:MAG: N-acetylmuramoyl-L-alanine amidase [Dehalococcoidia bacterium]|nr:MAG: N-acetylmuramoyl-L-alanine amidase [Dehalococcoidia bacterium]